ncbi:S1C family serine protease [Azohydromonas lata]|uniref:Trypsin-like peptidase domain-containing protein n=1 Tax=Azohydromonas lata TaxID=45677 RepID=A0ABU5IKA6_9BURK|nr:trypsin-like peptidase domain-containing protein [Azohydromonas lata]MDZ5459335.1 trypsin-like peptidase domain-containing protein [Azohydromonas lata]
MKPSHPLPLQPRRAVLQGLLLGACALGLGLPPAVARAQKERPQALPRPITPRGPLDADERNHIDVFKRVSPSVVNITSLALQRDMFSLNVSQVPTGTGTGFIWDDAGHVVTNFHVIQEASGARVTLSDQSTYRAELVGAFPDRDLAVLRIEAPKGKLPAIPVGSSRDLLVGQKVYAIGNPFGLDQTMTTGIVSALNREIESVTRRTIRGVIQTDAAINPGNSGGPLLDSAGRLIGVNTAIYSPSGGSSGIGFAIPVDEVNRIVPRLIRDGRIERPSLGIAAGTRQLQEALKLPKGVALLRVTPGWPAQRAGLQPFARAAAGGITAGDVITAVNGAPVEDFDDLLNELERFQSGDTVTLSVWRSGRTRQVSVKLAAGEA